MSRHRQCIPVRGDRQATAAEARRCLSHLSPGAVLWVSEVDAPEPFLGIGPRRTRGVLGQSFDAVVLDLHGAFDPNVLGQVHGLVWGGGALVLRLPPFGEYPLEGQESLAVFPHSPPSVGHRIRHRLDQAVARHVRVRTQDIQPRHAQGGSAEQDEVVRALVGLWTENQPQYAVLQADRGRGKSSALGLALARHTASGEIRACITAPQRASAGEVLRFAQGTTESSAALPFVAAEELAYGDHEVELIVVDEAAQLPVPLLMAMVHRHPNAHFSFASTVRGYEGTGRGFALRFVPWLRHQGLPTHEMTMEAPIRWGRGCPLEALVYDALLLDAAPAHFVAEQTMEELEHQILDQDVLASNEDLLRQFFGLLVHAHYRTTPGDLRRMLDAPNIRLHCLLMDGQVAAATLVALEGALPADLCEDVAWGRTRLRGHALAETLVSHSGRPSAGGMEMIRSVRIAVHPALRRRGLATRLTNAVHQTYSPDLFGTLFGATAELLDFRRSVGYELVRVGASRGSRTGEPAAVMVRPVSPRAKGLLASLRTDLARDLPLQLELMQGQGELHLEPPLVAALRWRLAAPTPLSETACLAAVASFAFGPRTLEAAAVGLTEYYRLKGDALHEIDLELRGLIHCRIGQRLSWAETMAFARLPSIPATMRALRRAVRQWVLVADPHLARRGTVPKLEGP